MSNFYNEVAKQLRNAHPIFIDFLNVSLHSFEIILCDNNLLRVLRWNVVDEHTFDKLVAFRC